MIIKNIKNDKDFTLKFKYLVGSDGMKSKVRSLFNISYNLQTQILYNDKLYDIRDLYETSLIVNYKSDPSLKDDNNTNFCPSLELIDDAVIDPWSITFEYDIIDAVFKRFYFHHCQLQILLNHKIKMNIIMII